MLEDVDRRVSRGQETVLLMVIGPHRQAAQDGEDRDVPW